MTIPFKLSQCVNYDTLLEGNEKNEEQEGQGGAPSGLEKTRVAIVPLKQKYHPLFFFFNKRMNNFYRMNN